MMSGTTKGRWLTVTSPDFSLGAIVGVVKYRLVRIRGGEEKRPGEK